MTSSPAIVLRRRVFVRQVLLVVAGAYRIDVDDLLARDNRPHFVVVRQIIMYLAAHLTNASHQQIARWVRRDRTTVLHGVATIERRLIEPGIGTAVAELRQILLSGAVRWVD